MRNTLTIFDGDLNNAIDAVQTVNDHGQINHFDLTSIAKPDEHITFDSHEWYDFWFDHWGSRSNTFFTSKDGNVIEFLTELTPPLEAVTKWAKEHCLTLEMKSTLGGMYARHVYNFHKGNLVKIDSYQLEL